jgi:hypothetical protein
MHIQKERYWTLILTHSLLIFFIDREELLAMTSITATTWAHTAAGYDAHMLLFALGVVVHRCDIAYAAWSICLFF